MLQNLYLCLHTSFAIKLFLGNRFSILYYYVSFVFLHGLNSPSYVFDPSSWAFSNILGDGDFSNDGLALVFKFPTSNSPSSQPEDFANSKFHHI